MGASINRATVNRDLPPPGRYTRWVRRKSDRPIVDRYPGGKTSARSKILGTTLWWHRDIVLYMQLVNVSLPCEVSILEFVHVLLSFCSVSFMPPRIIPPPRIISAVKDCNDANFSLCVMFASLSCNMHMHVYVYMCVFVHVCICTFIVWYVFIFILYACVCVVFIIHE